MGQPNGYTSNYDHNKHDTEETRRLKSEAAKRGRTFGRARAERARIAARIEEIAARAEDREGVGRRDLCWYLDYLHDKGVFGCRRVG